MVSHGRSTASVERTSVLVPSFVVLVIPSFIVIPGFIVVPSLIFAMVVVIPSTVILCSSRGAILD